MLNLSPHQDDFFNALNSTNDIELSVRYFNNISKNRVKVGWENNTKIQPFEKFVKFDIYSAMKSLPNWIEYIHIIPGISNPFLIELVNFLIKNNVKWIHWSERSGINLARMVNFNSFLIYFLRPIFFYLRGYYAYARKINYSALGAFAQGILAKNDFIKWGINEKKIEYLEKAKS